MTLTREQRAYSIILTLALLSLPIYYVYHQDNVAAREPVLQGHRYTPPAPDQSNPRSQSYKILPTGSYQSLEGDSENSTWKTILFWDHWFGGDWSNRFGTTSPEGLRAEGCPSWRCRFTYDRLMLHGADAVLFRALAYPWKSLPSRRVPAGQRWVLVDVEAPPEKLPAPTKHSRLASSLVNWTMTYHSQSDVVAFNGYFLSHDATERPLRPNLMSEHGEAVRRLTEAVARNATLKEVLGPSWLTYVNKTRVVAWMSSHCPTRSRREEYVTELKRYLQVDTYGRCGDLKCGPRHVMGGECWERVLQPNYSFYLAMENAVCDDYITEKLYNPLVYNLVPVVWGGANYSRYLPPHSFIDARHYHPRELAELLLRLHRDPVAYGRYHMWRAYLRPVLMGSLCEVCHLVHASTSLHHYQDLALTRHRRGRCTEVASPLFGSVSPGSWKDVIVSNYSDDTYATSRVT
ncbi:alpha-(1,3)-fucosyltransferase C isoform X2 [Procambarus clarkii]|uniref:alpha-(1,3)-fucosyltransferase C isoform X2 n=1 Tax=Procambarus clarkii TaxID=6728 RepID=UPI001E676F27|nr:alpha-(1,3)-fucosyltransferase C-like isoform X2 [Procambarus clarkii]